MNITFFEKEKYMELKDRVKVIFFDLDNTLWDFEKNSCLTLKELYRDYIEELDSRGVGCQGFVEIFIARNEELWEEYRQGRVKKDILRVLRFKRTFSDLGIVNDELVSKLEPEYLIRTSNKPYLVDNALEILDFLYGRYKLGIITNGFTEAQEIKLKNTELNKYFDFIVISEKVGLAKPDPRIIDYALGNYNLDKDNIVFIGDDYMVDMQCAHLAGISGIWLNRKDEKFNDEIKCTSISNLIELKTIFK